MEIPEAAIKAALAAGHETAVHGVFDEGSEATVADVQGRVIRSALQAALPALRKQWEREIEAWLDKRTNDLDAHPTDQSEWGEAKLAMIAEFRDLLKELQRD